MPFSSVPFETDEKGRIIIQRPINWNRVEDQVDQDVWQKLTSQFWLPEKISLAGDLGDWNKFTPEEKDATNKVFTGLSGLDTLQGHVGAPALVPDARTQHEVAVLNNIAFMEEVHAKSYSATSATFISSEENEEYFRWFAENDATQYKIKTVIGFYYGESPLMRKAASTILESFLFYSGFYLPLYWASRGRLTNTADLIRLIIRDEAVHGYYIGYKFQQAYAEVSPEEQARIKDATYDLLMDLYSNEVQYTEEVYDQIGLTEDVKKFLHYNGNKALMNLGFDPLFSKDITDVNPAIMNSLSLTSETHDFFSGAGSSYSMAVTEELTQDDWDDVFDG